MVTKKPLLSENDKAINVYAAVGVGFVCVVIGLPLWWKTTEVYRVSLPYSDIQTLSQSRFQYTVDVDVVSFDDKISSAELANLNKQLMVKLGVSQNDAKSEADVRSKYRTSVRECTVQEAELLKSSSSVSDLDSKLKEHFRTAQNLYHAVILPSEGSLQLQNTVVGLYQNVFFTMSSTDLPQFVEEMVHVIRNTVVREGTVHKGYITAKGARGIKPDKESMRSVRSNPRYDVTITLVSPQPDIMDVQWDLEEAVEAYLEPLVQQLAPYTTVNIKSQVLYFTRLLSKPKRDWQQDKESFYFTEKELPHMINPLEAKLGSPASNNPELNLIVYVPTSDQYPLYIRDSEGKNIASNSFLSPQWGGIFVYNIEPPGEGAELPIRPSLDMKRVMEVFLTQMRLLLNLQSQDTGNVQFLPVGNSAVTTWEIEGWLRSRCIENLATATATLRSLAQLLGEISNIVIKDDIGQEVNTAVESVRKSQDFLVEGLLVEAFMASRSAIVASEKAFFDPSLLELLYFPEDQKFAIYIPLFLPISFPVIASLWQSYQWYRGRAKCKQE